MKKLSLNATAPYHLVEDHFDQLERFWEERYEHEYVSGAP